MSGDLYIVATPIGNLDDITLRALDVLKNADIIFAESVERTKMLLSHYDIKKKVLSYNKDNERRKVKTIESYIENSKIVAVVTDAGTPSISDPGFHLLSNIRSDIKIIPIPGVSSLSCALSVSKIPMNMFLFNGFLPKKENDRKKQLNEISRLNMPVCLFESKHRLLDLLENISEIYGKDTQIGIFRELTKVYETILYDKVENLMKYFKKNQPKGEFVVIVSAKKTDIDSKKDYLLTIKQLTNKNFSNKDIVEIINIISKDSKKEIYKNVLSIRHEL